MHLLSCRTAHSEITLVPQPKLNEIVGGVVARYQEIHKIRLHANIFQGNHYHLAASADEGKIPLFAADMDREIAKRVNRYLGRKGVFWHRRYDDLIAIEEADALEAVLYVTTNAVKHGLVSHPRNWPGVNSYHQLLGAKAKEYSFFHHAAYNRAKRAASARGEFVRREDYETRHKLVITPLPMFEELSPEERHAKMDALIEERTKVLCDERRQEGKGFLGRKRVLSQPIQGTFPRESNASPRPPCYTKNPEARAEFVKEEKARRESYAEASVEFRSGNYDAVFPEYCLLPPLHYVPRGAREYQYHHQ